ncbi:MAG: FHA domain-containing protein [Candidatus Aminicenantes bacterium]|nr:FHA domain-containing protein [Candidatus Aminicenantes bacterium]
MHIFYTTESGDTKEFKSESELIVVGRLQSKQSNYLSLKDEKASAHHARLTHEDGEYWIEDLGSTNGTWVNNKKIKVKTQLKPKSKVCIGGTTLTVETAPSKSSRPPVSNKKRLPERTPDEMVKANEPLPDLFLDDSSSQKAHHKLSVFCELSAALGKIDSLESLASILLVHLHKAFPHKGSSMRSGLLLGDDLVLKAYHPDDKPPTCSTSLARYVLTKKKACLWNVGAQTEVEKSASLFLHETQSAMYAPVIWKNEVLGVLYADASIPKGSFDKEDLQLMQAISSQAAMFMKNLALQQTLQREAYVKDRLLAQFPQKIAERLAKQPSRISFASERVEEASVLFSDVRGFTKLSAKMEPEQVVKMLNDMFHDLTPITLKYNGTVDKYMGDAILAVFGCPDPDELQWDHAVQAALEMQAAIQKLQTSRWEDSSAFRIGIGIHCGPVIHGFIGARERMEYTVIGSTINVASRYCDAASPGEILISPAVYARLHNKVEVDHPARLIETKHEGNLKAYVVRNWRGKAGD